MKLTNTESMMEESTVNNKQKGQVYRSISPGEDSTKFTNGMRHSDFKTPVGFL